jgi:hypothetical protein
MDDKSFLGSLVYLLIRGQSMNDRLRPGSPGRVHQPGADEPPDPSAQIAAARDLQESGAIDDAEYDALRNQAMN